MPKTMKPEYRPIEPDEILGYLIEECGELQAALGKTLRWGWTSFNPELSVPDGEDPYTNAQWVLDEMLDVERGIRLLRELLAARSEEE